LSVFLRFKDSDSPFGIFNLDACYPVYAPLFSGSLKRWSFVCFHFECTW
jgi:hypothetical protein